MKQFKKVCALSCAATLIISGFSGCGSVVRAAEKGTENGGLSKENGTEYDVEVMENAITGLTDAGIISSGLAEGKEETVYQQDCRIAG